MYNYADKENNTLASRCLVQQFITPYISSTSAKRISFRSNYCCEYIARYLGLRTCILPAVLRLWIVYNPRIVGKTALRALAPVAFRCNVIWCHGTSVCTVLGVDCWKCFCGERGSVR